MANAHHGSASRPWSPCCARLAVAEDGRGAGRGHGHGVDGRDEHRGRDGQGELAVELPGDAAAARRWGGTRC